TQMLGLRVTSSHFINPDANTAREELETWIHSIRLHHDPVTRRAIEFYASPWLEKWDPPWWCHDELGNKDSKHVKRFAEWLGLPPEDVANHAKSVLMWVDPSSPWTPWSDDYRHRVMRPVSRRVWDALCRKLAFPQGSSTTDGNELVSPPC